ncbi:MAG: S-layer homology domain-containing protein [Hominicoprocola sp.]
MKKKFLSVLLCLCMVMALLPTTALASYADDSYTFRVRVADQAFMDTESTISYWTWNGTASAEVGADDAWNVKYDPTTSDAPTVTLQNFRYEDAANAVRSQGPLNIVLIGTNVIKNTKTSYSSDVDSFDCHGIMVKGDLTITGSDDTTLEVTSGKGNAIEANDFSADGVNRYDETLTIENANITAKGYGLGIGSTENLIIENSTIHSTGDEYHGLQGGYYDSASGNDGKIEITNSTITAITTNGTALKTEPIVTGDYLWKTTGTVNDTEGWQTLSNTSKPNYSTDKTVLLKPGTLTPAAHKHCICGSTHTDVGDHTSENIQTFAAWTTTDSLPTDGNPYYLTDDVTLAGTWSPADGTVLCLNGNTLTLKAGITVETGKTLTITNCEDTGKILRDANLNTDCLFRVEGSLSISNVTIDGENIECTTESAVALYVDGGSVTMKSGVIENCAKSDNVSCGSAVFVNSGTVTMTDCAIRNNKAKNYGGAVYVYGGTFTMNGGSLTNNETTFEDASYGGGAIYNRHDVILNNVSITGNSSSRGGAIYNSSYGTLTITGGSISGNTATTKDGGNIHYYGNGIFHSSREDSTSVLNIGTGADIADEIYLDSTNAVKVVEIQAALTNSLNLVCNTPTEGRSIAEGSGYTLTPQDMARISVVNPGWYLKLDGNAIKLTETQSEAYLPVHLTSDDASYAVTLKKDETTVTLTYDSSTRAYTGNVNPGTYQVLVDGTDYKQTIVVSGSNSTFPLIVSVSAITFYTVTWKSQDGSDTLETDTGVAQGEQPSFDRATPAKEADAQYTYCFAGWATTANAQSGTAVGSLPAVTGNVTYYAAFSKTARSYSVTLNTNGATSCDALTSYTFGTGATLPIPTKTGCTFGGWYDNRGFTGTAVTEISATDTGDKTFYAKWTYNGSGSSTSPAYKVETLNSEDANGIISSDRNTARQGDTVTITVIPDPYYKVDSVIVKDQNGKQISVTESADGTFTFKMPASKVTVEPVFSWDNPFADVAENAYYAPAVEWALKNDVTTGSGESAFSPNGTCTRAQAVTFLWRAAGSPAPKSSDMPFTDVKVGSYYETAVLWAVENGITKGTGDTTFSPNATCSRGQIVSFLWRSQKSPASDSVNPFTDVAADAYYNTAVLWAAENGITGGTSATTFSPNNDCTRGQIVTFLYRWMVK